MQVQETDHNKQVKSLKTEDPAPAEKKKTNQENDEFIFGCEVPELQNEDQSSIIMDEKYINRWEKKLKKDLFTK
jgi:hypothetical protein